jgi:general stress protein 26
MTDLTLARERPAEQFWDMLGQVKAGMLGLQGVDQHMQPMAPYADREGTTLWFITKRDSDLFQSIQANSRAHFCIIGPGQDYYACVSGPLIERDDPKRLDGMWNSVVSAWFENGKQDSMLAMLYMRLHDGMAWASTGNPLAFGWEIAKAHATGAEPDVGVRTAIPFK